MFNKHVAPMQGLDDDLSLLGLDMIESNDFPFALPFSS